MKYTIYRMAVHCTCNTNIYWKVQYSHINSSYHFLITSAVRFNSNFAQNILHLYQSFGVQRRISSYVITLNPIISLPRALYIADCNCTILVIKLPYDLSLLNFTNSLVSSVEMPSTCYPTLHSLELTFSQRATISTQSLRIWKLRIEDIRHRK